MNYRFQSLMVLIILLLCTDAAIGTSDEWVGSEVCKECHTDRHQSWYKTYHRTMTQTASPESVVGQFDGQPVTAWGVTVRPVMRNGDYWFDYYRPGAAQAFSRQRIVRTVGSHRYQQYLTQAEGAADNYYRLHWLWHIEDKRWVHMNAAFLGDDHQHFDQQVALWNHNCIFCHNTGPEPHIQNYDEMLTLNAQGKSLDVERQSLYRSTVAELGISCETCHGPAAEHVKVNRNPIRRWWNKIKDSDSSIIHPDKLSAERSVQVCGQCHGQRVPRNQRVLEALIRTGPPYRAGDDLNNTMQPVWMDSQVPGDAQTDRFRLRFWPDETPRLTAYEYQGLLQSECYIQSEQLSCSNCHSMHAGNSAGMVTDWQLGNGPCLECHESYEKDISAHTRHSAESEGSLCYNCHMPKINYGVMTFHRSHRIEVPAPMVHSQQQRPNACNQCHLDKSTVWAAAQKRHLWNGKPLSEPDGETASGVVDLFAGDPVQRALAAWSIEQGLLSQRLAAGEWLSYLLIAMRDDQYPAVRRFSFHAVQAAAEYLDAETLQMMLEKYDFIASSDQRNSDVAELISIWGGLKNHIDDDPNRLLSPSEITPEAISKLQKTGRQRSAGINIGE